MRYEHEDGPCALAEDMSADWPSESLLQSTRPPSAAAADVEVVEALAALVVIAVVA